MLRGLKVFAVLCCCWEAFCLAGVVPGELLPSPVETGRALWELAWKGMPPGHLLHRHALHSLGRVAAGTGLAVLLGIPLGLALGASARFRSVAQPVINFLRPIPPLAWIPLAILWFGLGFASAVYLIFLGAFFPVVLSTCSGVASVERVHVEALKVLGAGRWAIWRKVLLPGAMPSVLTGVRVGMGIGWMTLVAAEFTGVRGGYGLGFMIMNARDLQRIDEVVAGMVAIGCIGLAMEWGLARVSRRLLRWT
ncbi:MAG: ABC transporter permease [Desulfovibrio sp.]|jgi:ABC-type nitrate/sulfonate/bicarbonate transport system permease component|nr:ABC transporter permease [Desulfovibrio sp.]